MTDKSIIASHLSSADHASQRVIRVPYLVPIAVLIVLVLMFGWALTHNPRLIPSALIGKPVPEFNLPPVQGRVLGLSSTDLKGEVSLVNVFASWCVACREEHSLFVRMKTDGVVPVHGLNYKDEPDNAAQWLNRLGDPYTRTGADVSGRTAMDWGVYGVPETFVISKDGRIAYKHIGQLTPEAFDNTILPLIRRLRQQ